MKFNILHITPNFNYACGRSYYVFQVMKYMKEKKHNVMLLTNGGDSIDRLESNDIPYVLEEKIHSKSIFAFFRNVSVLRNLVKDKKIDIIHTHHRYSELLAVQASKQMGSGRPKTVFTALSFVRRKYKLEYKSDRIIAVSNSIKTMLIDRFKVPKNKISLIHNFADTSELNEPALTDHGSILNHGHTFNILAIGRFHHEKNFEVLLRSLALLNDRNIKLILVGEGDKHTDYRDFISRNNVNVEIIVPQKDLLKYFQIADICVLPSTRDPFPNFMLQCGLHTKPFIGANVDGIAELIKEEVNGLLFKSGDESELAFKIQMFRENPEFAEHCATQLHSDVVNRYTQKYMVPKIEKLYRELD
jgi:glycosyltransferase involved in cell wall biosynthesis